MLLLMALSMLRKDRKFSIKLSGTIVAAFVLAIQPLVSYATPVINELMSDPVNITDAAGEWIEIKNNGTESIDISGWTVASATIPVGAVLNPGQLYVLCKTSQATQACSATASSLSLVNSGLQAVQLKNDTGSVVDEFSYNGTTAGQSIEVVRQSGTVTGENNSVDEYLTNQTPPQSGNFGTPGAENTAMAVEETQFATQVVNIQP